MDNSGIIFNITSLNLCCDPSLEWSSRDDSDDGSPHMFSFRNKKKYL